MPVLQEAVQFDFDDALRLEALTPLDVKNEVLMLATLDLPAEDGIPMETNWHRIEMNLLIDSIHAHWRDRNDYFAGGNMFIYFSLEQVRRKDYRGPDFFVVKDVDGTHDRESWVVWREEGRYPNVIVELASPSTIAVDLRLKKDLYERTFHTAEYFCFDPVDRQLVGWHLVEDEYLALPPNEQGWLWSRQLNLWLGIWTGEFQRNQTTWLRFYTAESQLVLTMAEAEAHRAEVEAQRAEVEAQRAEVEAQRAEVEAQRAEAEAQRAEVEAQRADQADRRAELAEAELARLRLLLVQHGITDSQT